MTSATTSPERPHGEPHPAIRLAEAVCALIAAIAGPAWFWRFLPGGRALWASLHQLGQDFAALMQRLATAPALPVIDAPARRQAAPTGEVRPRRAGGARQPRRGTRALRAAISTKPQRRPVCAPLRCDHAPRAPQIHLSPNIIAIARERRSQKPASDARETRVLFVSI